MPHECEDACEVSSVPITGQGESLCLIHQSKIAWEVLLQCYHMQEYFAKLELEEAPDALLTCRLRNLQV